LVGLRGVLFSTSADFTTSVLLGTVCSNTPICKELQKLSH
jgi:hypothetical protein